MAPAGSGHRMFDGQGRKKTATKDGLLSTCRHRGNERKPASGWKVEKKCSDVKPI